MDIGTKVRIKPTGDEDIDRYIGQIGEIVKIEQPTIVGVSVGDVVAHYFVQMPDGQIVVINDSEFEVME